ncbi:L-aspartate oxidase [Paenactinomyces guangxiensis]|uniref:L-aspartate oxidase n=1 Tax=Paenactinomyces guangxiensis TaxID=1490290 RepID=A0A7W1WMR3_9BACL|nr:L-aspartate oxidase [Paenactinomyces guangxiensis]MBA4492742.1 L-aspartate oxidase [Paenactinomyces guangxiensis]MBH8590409.1 L-aspartate oxidase [Paenactinomyces guangxiensis]
MTRKVTDFIVVGSGIAGLMTALSLGGSGQVILLTKAREEESNSYRAQGGIAAAIGEDDSPELHRQDTLRTGAELCDPGSVDVLVEMAPQTIQLLTKWGTRFDRDGDRWALGREGSHSVSRILHIAGDATGAGITSSLLEQVRNHSNIRFITHTMVADLIVSEGACRGVVTVDEDRGPVYYMARKGVVLATGGCGQVYRYTTNDLVSTGDGFAMARRAGAALMDMEFIQFHPTALAVEQNPMFLVSEAVRGEGAFLVNDQGEAFMERYHEWKDLAPRDVVSRAIFSEMQAGRKVFLDAGQIGSRFAERFPKIYRECRKYGIDPARSLIPVTPAAHFVMGGIRTDVYGRTTLPRLFACGEVACTGVHGANRLASNSLLEGAVFAQRVAAELSSYTDQSIGVPGVLVPALCKDKQTEDSWKQQIKEIMWNHAGIVRSAQGLKEGILKLRKLREQIPAGFFECNNMLTSAQMIMEAALWRQESRGGHYRYDYPEPIPEWSQKHNVI